MNRLTLLICGACVVVAMPSSPAEAQSSDEEIAAHISALKQNDLVRRRQAMGALSGLGAKAVPAIPALIEVLSDPDKELRRYAAGVLQGLGRAAESAVPALWKMAADDDWYTRGEALKAMLKIAPDAMSDVPARIVELKSTEVWERRRAAERLAKLYGRAKPALEPLCVALKDESADVRGAAALALAELRKEGHAAVDRLLLALNDRDAEVREKVAQALTYIGPGTGHGDAVPPLVTALRDPNAHVRSTAARALMRDWSGIERAIPALIPALEDFVQEYGNGACINAGYALKEMAKHGHNVAVVEALIETLKKSPGRHRVVDVLGTIGPAAGAAIPILQEIARGTDAKPAQAAAVALGKISGSPGPTLQKLIDALHDDDMWEREDVARDLGSMGASAAGAVPALIAQVKDQNGQAVAAFRAAAEQGSAEGQFALAMQLRDGLGVAADAKEAAAWFRKAAEQGHAGAQRQLGIFYRQGRGVPQDDDEADTWNRKSTAERVVERLRYRPDDGGPFDEALAYCKQQTVGTDRHELLVAAVTFEHGGRFTRYHYVDTESFPGGCDMRYERSAGFPSRHGPQHTPLEMERLRQLLAALPEGIQFAPFAERVIVSTRVDGTWTTRWYDAEALPRVVRNLLHFMNLPTPAPLYPPQEAASWVSPTRHKIQVAYQADGALLLWGYAYRVDVWNRGRPAEAADHVVRWTSGYPLAVAPVTNRVVVSRNGQLRLSDLATGAVVAELSENAYHNDHSRVAAFSADGRTLTVQDIWNNRRLFVFDAVTGSRRGVIELEPSHTAAAVTADGRFVATHSEKATSIWNLTTFQLERRIDVPATNMAFLPDGKTLLLGESHSTVGFWDWKAGKKRFSAQTGDWSGPLACSPDGSIIAAGGRMPKIRLYDARDGQLLGIAEGHTYGEHTYKSILSLAFAPDGKTFATGGDDGLIKLWNVADIVNEDWKK